MPDEADHDLEGARVQFDPPTLSPLPARYAARVEQLVRRASNSGVPERDLTIYAYLLAAAEAGAADQQVSQEHADRAWIELAGELHGFTDGYDRTAEAMRLYNQGREAQQHIHNSLEGLLSQAQTTIKVISDRDALAPLHVRNLNLVDAVKEIAERLVRLVRSTELGVSVIHRARASQQRPLSVKDQTYIWWRYFGPQFPPKWADMHEVANAWRLTKVREVHTFRRTVLRVLARVTSVTIPPGYTPTKNCHS